MDRSEHWEGIYRRRAPDAVGWFEADPAMSRRFITEAVDAGARSVIDIGGGASTLVDHLLTRDLDRIAVLDISPAGLDVTRQRLGAAAAARVEWIVGDVVELDDLGRFDVWHDRAVFHFLTEPADRERYVRLAERTLAPGGTAVMATFAADGPETCSGLTVCRYDPEDLAAVCGLAFDLQRSERHVHTTPRGVPQSFVYSLFRRAA